MTSFSFASAQGPLPPEVRDAIREEIGGSFEERSSPLELPFSTPAFEAIRAAAEDDLRALLGLGDDSHVLFLQGGATAMFALAPMNLLRSGDRAAFVEAGLWSRRAAEAAAPWTNVEIAAKGDGSFIPHPESWRLSDEAVYCHVTTTETAEGLQYPALPKRNGVPFVADMTADFLTRPLAIAPFGLIYASAQKNLGVAGLTIAVINDELLERCQSRVPAPFSFARQAASDSKVNTPPVFAIAVAAKVLQWLRKNGGLDAARARNAQKAATLYAALDEDDFYLRPAAPADRSTVSIRFGLRNPGLEERFLLEAESAGLFHLRGHPAIGGLRASLYNGASAAAAVALADFLRDFRRRRG
jgi:phosphoserine aminotransferase